MNIKILDEKRLKLGLSIKEVSKKSNVAYATAYDFFKGNINPRIDTVEKIATALEISMSEIF